MASPAESSECISSSASTSTDDALPAKPKPTAAEKKAMYGIKLPEDIQNEKDLLKKAWEEPDKTLKVEQIKKICYEAFEAAENPFSHVVQLYAAMPDAKVQKEHTIAGYVLIFFGEWINEKENKDELYETHFSEEIQGGAVLTLLKHHAVHIKMVGESLRIDVNDESFRNSLVTKLEGLLTVAKNKDVLDTLCFFDFKVLQDEQVLQALIGCIVQDKVALVATFFDNCTIYDDLKERLVTYFDDLVGRDEYEVFSVLGNFSFFKKDSLPRFTGKSLEKMVEKFTKDLAVDKTIYAPNLVHVRSMGNIRFFAHRRFLQNLLTDDAYFLSVKCALEALKTEDVLEFVNYQLNSKYEGTDRDAIRWLVYFGLLYKCHLRKVEKYLKENPDAIAEIKADIAKKLVIEDVQAYLFDDDSYPIYITNTWDDVQKVMAIIDSSTIVGLDTETKPQHMNSSQDVALFQIAFEHEAYLLDYCALEKILTVEQWEAFLKCVLTGSAIKIGFDFLNDMKSIFSGPMFQELKPIVDKSNVLCLKNLTTSLLQDHPRLFTLNRTIEPGIIQFSLKELAEVTVQEQMDKGEQCSDWSLRPLRKDQKIYAAKDAQVVISIYRQLQKLCQEQEIDFEKYCQTAVINSLKKEKMKKDKIKTNKILDSELVEKLNLATVGDRSLLIKADEIKCIVDLMLLGLGQELRRLGVDVLIPKTKEEFIEYVRDLPDRTVFTRGKQTSELKSRFSNKIITIYQGESWEMLSYCVKLLNFEIQIFSRCKDCNSKDLVRVPAPVMQALHEYHRERDLYEDEKEYDFEKWMQLINSLDKNDYDGVFCRAEVPKEFPDWPFVTTNDGVFDLTRNLVMHNKADIGTLIKYTVHEKSYKEGRLFYICSNCGKDYFDGANKKTYTEKLVKIGIQSC